MRPASRTSLENPRLAEVDLDDLLERGRAGAAQVVDLAVEAPLLPARAVVGEQAAVRGPLFIAHEADAGLARLGVDELHLSPDRRLQLFRREDVDHRGLGPEP